MTIAFSREEQALLSHITAAAAELRQDAFLIGGFVRDRYLGRPTKDMDVVTTGDGILLAHLVAKKLKPRPTVAFFKNFGTAQIKHRGLEVEFVGARRESYRGDSRKPDVEPGTLEDDQNRRDFTINAMAVSLQESDFGRFIDPFQGIRDCEDQIIRTPLAPDVTFSDDPLRMMRCVRFATQLGFQIHPETWAALRRNKERLAIISQERITDELAKIIRTPKPSVGFDLLYRTGLLEQFFPQMVALAGVEILEGKGHKDNFYHTLQVLDNVIARAQPGRGGNNQPEPPGGVVREDTNHGDNGDSWPELPGSRVRADANPGNATPDADEKGRPGLDGQTVRQWPDDYWLRWAAILHDIAKPATKKFEQGHGWTFHGHDAVGARMCKKIFQQLKLPLGDELRYVSKLVALHLRPISLSKEDITDSAMRRLLFDAGEELDDLMTLCESDITSKNENKVRRFLNNFRIVKERLQEVEANDQVRLWQPPVSGDDILSIFGLEANRDNGVQYVGPLKLAIREAILDGEIPNEREAALGLLHRKAATMGLTPV